MVTLVVARTATRSFTLMLDWPLVKANPLPVDGLFEIVTV